MRPVSRRSAAAKAMPKPKLRLFETQGFSMRPFLKQGVKVIVSEVPPADLKRSDLILYKSERQIICHRLVRKELSPSGWLLYARGDADASSTELVAEQAVIGKVVGIIEDGKIIDTAGLPRTFWHKLVLLSAPLTARALRLADRLRPQ
jgi:hypothetical protein